MHLEKLKIKGFKSFAERVELDLSEGISAIVGPNGSGKSNITDAIRWVLGEQSTKALRGKKMEDVIFAGTARKDPLGYAEVTLIMNNEDRSLPDYPEELHVMRRLFRSGESEYRINNQNCKLKDIQQIFMDTGLGKNGYSLISQGAIEDIINSSPFELRNIVEEAVGIVNYKTRKVEAERKLLRTQDNMDRINDILQELRKRRNPLKKQAEKARAFLALHDELKKTDLFLFVRRMDEIEEESEQLNRQFMQVSAEINSLQQKLLSLDRRFQTKQGNMQAFSEELRTSLAAQNTLDGEINACMGKLLVGEERLKHLGVTVKRLMDEDEKNRALLGSILSEKEEADAALLSGEDELRTLQEAIGALNLDKTRVENQYEQIRLQEEARLQDEATVLARKSEIEDELQNLRDSLAAEEVRKKLAEEGMAKDRVESEEEKKTLDRLASQITSEKAALIQKEQACAHFDREQQALGQRLEAIEQKLNVLKNNMRVNLKQQDYLKRIQEKYTDYYPGIQKVMTSPALSDTDRKNIYGPVGELITVPEAYARAIEVALGGKAQNIVVARVDTASRCIDLLKREKAGRATFLPMDRLKGRRPDAQDRLLFEKTAGFVGIASELVQFDRKFQITIDSLLSGILVVKDFKAAKAMSKSFSRYTVVTLDGEIFHVGGAIVGGANKGGKSSPFFKKLEIERLALQYAEDEKEVSSLEGEAFALTQKKTDAVKGLREAKAGIAAKEQLIWQSEQQKIAAREHCAEIERRLQEAKALCENAETLFEAGRARCEALKAELLLSEDQGDPEGASSLKEELREQLRELESRLTALKIREAGKTEQLRAARAKKAETEERLAACERALKAGEESRIGAEEERRAEFEHIEGSQAALDEKQGEKKALDARVDELRALQNETNTAMMDLSRQIQNGNHDLVVQNEAKNKIERHLDRLKAEKDHLEERIFARYELTLLMARDALKQMTVVPEELTEAKQRELRSQMNGLGSVNLSAVEEFAEVEERYGFLKGQFDDLKEGKKELEKIIQELYHSMENQFEAGFAKLQGYFSEVFSVLFEGGEARLDYTDPGHVMESGIELYAQPPGKKLKQLSLLSGGERSMTAIALLFAFLRLNPSPFCVIDEIDAALDDGNILRYTQYMTGLSDHIQFMLITHRKKTLEACDAIYGVTMSQSGISKLVSIRLSDYVEEV